MLAHQVDSMNAVVARRMAERSRFTALWPGAGARLAQIGHSLSSMRTVHEIGPNGSRVVTGLVVDHGHPCCYRYSRPRISRQIAAKRSDVFHVKQALTWARMAAERDQSKLKLPASF